ncbi:MAG: RNA polymerase sigma factor [Candidatus Pacebacteria bacterium]|nr:RNA polymerase sigma factor [Candidatus Paceibacterota bacterium]
MDSKATETAFLDLHTRFADPLFRHAYFKVSDREIALDITQESFLRMWDYLTAGNEVDNPKAFLFRIAGNLIIDHYRKKKSSSLETLQETGFDPAGADAATITDAAAGKEALSMLSELPEKDREALLMRHVEDLSVGEIAAISGESPNVISVRIHRATKKLRALLDHGST